jgi:hypothetical protein
MEVKTDPINEPLTETDLDVLSGMMIIFLHSAERIIRIIELEYERRYQEGTEYKRLCRLHGKAAVDAMMGAKVKEVIRGDERNKLGKILKAAKEFHLHMETLNESGRKAHRSDVTEWETFDAIIHDVNVLCYMYGLMGNSTTDDDELKILSTLKLLAKGDRVSPRVMARLKENVE